MTILHVIKYYGEGDAIEIFNSLPSYIRDKWMSEIHRVQALTADIMYPPEILFLLKKVLIDLEDE